MPPEPSRGPSHAPDIEDSGRWGELYASMELAADRLRGVARHTPVLESRILNSMLDAEVFLKAENLQLTGSFKFRGAYNRLKVAAESGVTGVVAHSSGNFAQAVAHAGQLIGLTVVVVMPADAPPIKAEAARAYGAQVVVCGPASEERAELAKTIAEERGLTLVQPYDDPDVIAGQGTAATELLDDIGAIDALLVPLGGGGLLSGCAVAVKRRCPAARIIGVEPAAMPKTALSLAADSPVSVPVKSTVMDGQMISRPGELTYPVITDLVDDVITIDDRSVLSTMRWFHERLKTVVEPSGASALAALMSGKADAKGRIAVILSGGNVGIEQMAQLCEAHRA